MADAIVIPDDDEDPEAGHDAAVAQGHAEAHADRAEEAALAAGTAVDEAGAVADLAMSAVTDAQLASEEAAASAEAAAAGESAVLAAIQAQTAVLTELRDEMRAAREPAPASVAEPEKQTPDRAPKPKRKGDWYTRKRGG